MNNNFEITEVPTKQVIIEINKEYTKEAEFLEEHADAQLMIAEELKKELKNQNFDANIEELRLLKEQIVGLKAEIKRLNEIEKMSLSSLVIRDIKSAGNKLVNLRDKIVKSIRHLHDNMKYQIQQNLSKAQEKLVQTKIGIVKGLINSIQGFIKDQQKKLDQCLEKLEHLSSEIQKDDKKPFEEKGDKYSLDDIFKVVDTHIPQKTISDKDLDISTER